MPNIKVKEFDIKLPFCENGYEFLFKSEFNKNKSLLFVRKDEKEFFLEVLKKDQFFLIKAEKITRISPVLYIKEALAALVKRFDLKPIYSNISTKNNKNLFEENEKYLKKIDYFISDFKTDKKVAIEIGFGSGRHLLKRAKENKDLIFIGIEIHKPSIEQLIKQIKLQKIENILIVDYDARIFLKLMDSQNVEVIYLHFPVPWDKKPHRRVISKEFLKEAKRVLAKDATLELRTDSKNYYEYTLKTLDELDEFDIKIRKNHKLDISSKYEDRWVRLGKDIYDVIVVNSLPIKKQKELFEIVFEDDFYKYFKGFYKNFKKACLRRDKFFVNFEDIYKINETEGILKVTLGSYNRSEHKYILFKDKNVKYFPSKPIPIEENQQAHNLLVEYIKANS